MFLRRKSAKVEAWRNETAKIIRRTERMLPCIVKAGVPVNIRAVTVVENGTPAVVLFLQPRGSC